jgi:acyl carrier protein
VTPEVRAAALIARALNIQGEVALDADMASLPAWDSMNHVAVLLEIEQELARPLLPEEVGSIDSVRAVARLLGQGAAG